MKEEYFWLKKVIECSANEQKHKPALIVLLRLYEQKWKAKEDMNQMLLQVSLKSLKHSLKQV